MIGKSALLLMPLLLNAREVAVKMLNPPVPPIAPVVEQLRASRITTVFCRSDNLFTNAGTGRNLREFRTLLAACGIKFYITAPVFLDPEAIEKDPGLAGVGSFGNPSKIADLKWYSFVCPARPEYRKRKMAASSTRYVNCGRTGSASISSAILCTGKRSNSTQNRSRSRSSVSATTVSD